MFYILIMVVLTQLCVYQSSCKWYISNLIFKNWGAEHMSFVAFHWAPWTLTWQKWHGSTGATSILFSSKQLVGLPFSPGGSRNAPQSTWNIDVFWLVMIQASSSGFLFVLLNHVGCVWPWQPVRCPHCPLCAMRWGECSHLEASGSLKTFICKGLQAPPTSPSSLDSFLLTMQ